MPRELSELLSALEAAADCDLADPTFRIWLSYAGDDLRRGSDSLAALLGAVPDDAEFTELLSSPAH